MALREVTSIVWVGVLVGGLGVVAVAAADSKPTKVEAEKAAKPHGSKDRPKAPGTKVHGASAPGANGANGAKVEDGKATEAPPAEAADALPAESPEPSMPPHIVGPKLVDLGDSTEIDLPAGMILLERTEAQKLLREMGNSPEDTVALVLKPGSDWMIRSRTISSTHPTG